MQAAASLKDTSRIADARPSATTAIIVSSNRGYWRQIRPPRQTIHIAEPGTPRIDETLLPYRHKSDSDGLSRHHH